MVDLRPDQLATVNAILLAEVPDHEVWAFGSRAKWTATDSSDLDLAIVTQRPLPFSRLARLREAFAGSYLPFKVDVVDLSRISEEFRKVITNQRVVLHKPEVGASEKWLSAVERRTLPLEESVETIIDYRGRTPKKVDTGIPLITAKIIKDGRIATPNEFISEEDYDEWMRRGIPQRGDVVLTTEAPLGEVAQLDGRRVALAQRVVALRGKKGMLDNSFLKYLLQSGQVQEQLKSRASGTTVQGIKQSELRKITLTLPAISEQRSIAQILGSLDDKIELNRRMNETLEAIAQAIFKSWFVDFDAVRARVARQAPPSLDPEIAALFPDRFEQSELGEIPAGWRVAPLPEVMQVNPPRRLRQGELAPYLDMANMPTRSPRALAVHDRQFGSGMRFMDGDTLVARITPCLENGKTCLVDFLGPDRVGWGSTEYIVLRPKPPLPIEFAYFLARTADFRAFAISNMTGTSGRQRVPVNCFAQYPIVVPSAEVAKSFGEFARASLAKIKANDEESRTLATMRDALIPKLLSGEIRVRDA